MKKAVSVLRHIGSRLKASFGPSRAAVLGATGVHHDILDAEHAISGLRLARLLLEQRSELVCGPDVGLRRATGRLPPAAERNQPVEDVVRPEPSAWQRGLVAAFPVVGGSSEEVAQIRRRRMMSSSVTREACLLSRERLAASMRLLSATTPALPMSLGIPKSGLR